jgi:hypothetical protein
MWICVPFEGSLLLYSCCAQLPPGPRAKGIPKAALCIRALKPRIRVKTDICAQPLTVRVTRVVLTVSTGDVDLMS